MIQPLRFNERAAGHLAQALVSYGQQQRNPVLDVIPEDGSFRVNEKYPRHKLRFGNDSWRGYYHSHESPHWRTEHGHFHLFFRIDASGSVEQDWSHVVALGMDNSGQPIRWFTVNNWVTGDRWLAARELRERVEFSIDDSEPVIYWLTSMLVFYQHIIGDLLVSRDRALDSFRATTNTTEVLKDRNIYDLSLAPITLLQDLTVALDRGKE